MSAIPKILVDGTKRVTSLVKTEVMTHSDGSTSTVRTFSDDTQTAEFTSAPKSDRDSDNVRRVNSIGPMPKGASLDNTPAGKSTDVREREYRDFEKMKAVFCMANDCY